MQFCYSGEIKGMQALRVFAVNRIFVWCLILSVLYTKALRYDIG